MSKSLYNAGLVAAVRVRNVLLFPRGREGFLADHSPKILLLKYQSPLGQSCASWPWKREVTYNSHPGVVISINECIALLEIAS